MSRQPLSWQRRAARLGWITVTLAAMSVALLALAVWALASEQPRAPTDSSQRSTALLLPVDVQLHLARPVTVLALGLALGSLITGIAATQTAAAMRVLARDRRIPEPLSPEAARARRLVLGPADLLRALHVDQPSEWPISALPPRDSTTGLALVCTVLIPAHDEQAVLARTLDSLAAQTRPPDRVIVIADNCTDSTADIAREHGVEVVETVANTQKKAGALNQVLGVLLPVAGVADVFVVMDADSTIAPTFLETGLQRMHDDPDLIAVGGLFSGEDGGRVLGQLQRNEFTRYQRIIGRREGRVFVLTGTASLFRAYALRALAEARGSLVPGTAGQVYDTLAMTEDNEITLALKTLGARMTSPPECRVTTEIMSSWSALWRQRLRWQRGAVENIGAYGFTRTTASYWGQQLALAYGVIALNSYFLLMTVGLLASDSVRWSPFWIGISLIFILERVVTVWAAGWRGRALAAPLFVEIGYALFLQATFVTSLLQIATGRKAGWNYVPRESLTALAPAVLVGTLSVGLWSPLPSSVLQSAWFEALALFVGLNTLAFAALSVLQMLPPLRRTLHRRAQRRAAA